MQQKDSQTWPQPAAERESRCRSLLAARTPADVAALLPAAHPLLAERLRGVLWSAHWPRGIRGWPQDPDPEMAARAARELSARRGGARPDPHYAVLCDDQAGDAALLLLAAPLPADAALEDALALSGARMAGLLERERLHESVSQLEEAERLQRALYAIADMAGSDFDMPDLLHGLHRIVSDLMYAENFYIALYDEERDSLRFVYFADTVDTMGPAPTDEVPMAAIERGLTWYLIRDARALMGDAAQLQQQVSGPLALHGADSVDWLGVPMAREGKVIGALVVQSYLEGVRYSHADMSLLAFVAEHVLTALERKHSQEELEQRVAERTHALAEANAELSREVAERQRGERLQAALYRIAALASSEESADVFFRHVHEVVGGLIAADNFYVALVSADGTQVEFPYSVDQVDTLHQARCFGRGLTEYVLRTGRTQLVDLERERELVAAGELAPDYLQPASAQWIGAPLMDVDRAIGVVAVQSYADRFVYDERDAELLTFVSYQIASSLQRRRAAAALRAANARLEERVEQRTRELREQIVQRELAEAQLKHQVMHDPLTGLPNRVYLRDRIERAVAQVRRDPGRNFALLYIDVDRFKQVNDSLGHLAGDEVLKEVARRLGGVVRDPDVVARLSGDEFAVLLEHVDPPETASKVAQRIITLQQAPIELGEHVLQASASIGVAIGDRRYHSADAILRDADIALYRAKQHGRNRFVLFDEQLHRAAMDDLALEDELRAAGGEAFVPWFQPLVRLDDAGVCGYEALLRWRHPRRGVLAPADFLQVAEDSGVIEQIDWQVFRQVCESARVLLAPGQFVAINITPRLLRLRDFDSRLLRLLEDSGLAPAALRIEVTEDALFGDPESVTAILRRLRAAGVETVLDDFGSGTSALGSVREFPLRMVKIDRQVVAQLDDPHARRARATVGAVLALTQGLALDAVAEGVETDAQRDFLARMGCRYGQGHLFGRAQPLTFWLQGR